MSSHIRVIALLLAPGFVAIACAQQAGTPPEIAAAPAEGVLVLKSGRVVSGRISNSGRDHFLVVKPDARAEIRIARHEVDFQADSLQAAYLRQRSRLRKNASASEHLALADWCLRSDLRTAATDEVLTAMSIDPKNARLKYYFRRIQQARQPRAQSAPRGGRPSKPAAETPQQLLQLARSLPESAVEQFTAHIQPLLVNRCGAANCHGLNTKTSFRLIRPTVGRTYSQRFSQRNLSSAMANVEQGAAEKSGILIKAVEAHGGQIQASLGEKDLQQFELLVGWVRLVARDTLPTQPRQLGRPQAIYSQPMSNTAAEVHEPVGKKPEELKNDDPFDPEAFNRNRLK